MGSGWILCMVAVKLSRSKPTLAYRKNLALKADGLQYKARTYLSKFVQDEVDVFQIHQAPKQRCGDNHPEVVAPREEVHRRDNLWHTGAP